MIGNVSNHVEHAMTLRIISLFFLPIINPASSNATIIGCKGVDIISQVRGCQLKRNLRRRVKEEGRVASTLGETRNFLKEHTLLTFGRFVLL
jgi:hypothetical protein